MKYLLSGVVLLGGMTLAQGQSQPDCYCPVLGQIESNNLALKSLDRELEATRLGNRTEIYLENPEVGFNYLYGSPKDIGRRRDFSVTQSFDFPLAYLYRSRVANQANRHADMLYRLDRIALLLEAKETCIELTYMNAVAALNQARLDDATSIAEAYRKKDAAGETNVIELNKALRYQSTMEADASLMNADRKELYQRLQWMNGGQEIVFNLSEFQPIAMAKDFDVWFADVAKRHPALLAAQAEVAEREDEVKLKRSECLPKFSAGYMLEDAADADYRGLTLGMSIPLWEGRNKVRHAKANAIAAQAKAGDVQLQLMSELQRLFIKAQEQAQTVETYKSNLDAINDLDLLRKAFDGGEMTLIEYLLETQYYYDASLKLLGAQRDLALTVAKLRSIDL